jgi:hypothetical protein
MYQISDDFFRSIGMRSVPDLFWKYLMLEKSPDKEVRNSINWYLMPSKINSINNYKNEESITHKNLNIETNYKKLR